MKKFLLLVLCALTLCALASCGVRNKPLRADDPYLYKRGPWNLNSGGIVSDIPQYLWQMTESMFGFGLQPIDPPSVYESQTTAVNPQG